MSTSKVSSRPAVETSPPNADRMDAGASPSDLIDARIDDLGDWRGEMLSRIRALIKEAEPEVIEEWKWRGTPVWSCKGQICTGETYKQVVKMTFAKGASLADPTGLFNSSLDGNVSVWSCKGQICTGETYKQVVKMTFAKGASLADPTGLFNSSLDGNVRRAIDFHEGDTLDEAALKSLIRAAVELNKSKPAARR